MSDSIFTTDDTVAVLNTERLITIGLTSGVFDLFHTHHLQYLKECRKKCNLLVVGVDADSLVFGYKHKWPVIEARDRAAILQSLRCVDLVFIMEHPGDFARVVPHVDVVFKNSNLVYGAEVVGREKLVVIPDEPGGESTTNIIRRISEDAAEHLDHMMRTVGYTPT